MASFDSSSQNDFGVTLHLYPPTVLGEAGRRLRVVDAEMIAWILTTGLIPCLEILKEILPTHENYKKNRTNVTAWLEVLRQGNLAVLA